MRRMKRALAAAAVLGGWISVSLPAQADTPLTNEQLAVMMFVDQGRSYGYQTMMARIQVETVQAELERDQAILQQTEDLFRKNAVPLIDYEIAQLKDAWNRKQLIVAQKSLEYVSAEYAAMTRMAEHFAGVPVTVEQLYATFRKGWDAGCEKGPDEVEAMKAWAAYAEKSLERAGQLNARGHVSDSELQDRQARVKIARANYLQREAGLDRCRTVLFPTLEQVMAIGRK